MGRRRKKTPKTRVFVVQDKSGSMSSRRAETISGFNEYLTEVSKDAKGDVTLSLVQFDTTVSNRYTDKPIKDVPKLDPDSYVPGGMTALHDAAGRAIKDAEKVVSKGDNVIVVIMTDGGENSSREYTHEAILAVLEQKRKDGWDFVFLGAGEEAWNAGQLLGFDYQTTLNYSGQDAHAHQQSYAALANATITKTVSPRTRTAFSAADKANLESPTSKSK